MVRLRILSAILFVAFFCAPNSWSSVTAKCTGVSFWATGTADGGVKMEVSGGSATLFNEKDETVAQGDLKSVDGFMTVLGSKDASFVHSANSEGFPASTFSDTQITQFAEVELGQGGVWVLRDASFAFILEVPNLNQAVVVVSLDKSLARASSIHLQHGVYHLWGYTITVDKAAGIVKFAHGRIVDATDAVFK
jgi:phage gp45-like